LQPEKGSRMRVGASGASEVDFRITRSIIAYRCRWLFLPWLLLFSLFPEELREFDRDGCDCCRELFDGAGLGV
jgi:hypothetical protein